MEPLSPAFLTALAGQLGGLSAFLGGFAATFLATLLVAGQRSRAAAVAIALACLASVAFIVAVVASTMLIAALHPEAPGGLPSTAFGRTAMTGAFAVGCFALLGAVGAGGRLYSPRMGRVTGTIAGIGLILVVALVVRIG